MMFKRLVIISCCALTGFALGRWVSAPDRSVATKQNVAASRVPPLDASAGLPPPERAGRVPFVDIYRSLRSSAPGEHTAYLHSIQELPDGPDRRAALTAFFQCMATVSPQEAAALVRQVGKDDIERAVNGVLAATTAPDTPVLVKMLLDLPDIDPRSRELKLKGQMFFWAAFDPTAVTQFIEQYQSVYPSLATSGFLQCLTVADLPAAQRWLKEHPDLAREPRIIKDYLEGLEYRDPASARRYLIEHATDETVQPSLQAIARLTFARSADDAAQFISQLPSKEARRTALGAILNINTELFVNGENNRTALSAGLVEWVTKFSQDEWPSDMSAFLNQWREFDPDDSVSWMAKLPAPSRSAIARELVRDLPPEQVKEVLGTIAGDFHREVLTAVAEYISKAPADAREELIQELGLPAEDAAQLAAITR